jgi:HNH endonuclease
MSPNPPANDLNIVLLVGVGILGWYVYQIASRKKQWIRYKTKRMLVFLIVYVTGVYVLAQQRLPSLEVGVVSALAGLGSSWLLVAPPKGGRRIPKDIRRQVIARDLTSKGLDWDPAKYHIDHIVPFSRGGDNSLRNLRVVQKGENLRKGGKMPSFWEFLKR